MAGHIEIVQLLLTAKADPNICDKVCIMYRDVYIPYTCVLCSLHVHVYNTIIMYYISTICYNHIHVHVHVHVPCSMVQRN